MTTDTLPIDNDFKAVFFGNDGTLHAVYTLDAEYFGTRTVAFNVYDVEELSMVDEFPNGYATVPSVIGRVTRQRADRESFWNHLTSEFQRAASTGYYRGVA